ncbi:hypothetical protein N7454_004470 [Penicillium verhagenii]|nr:hypothetical protein N7454_004470 [Penicillium verhagenii]
MTRSDSHYRIKVTAGPSYDPATHQDVQVNGEALALEGDHASVTLAVRIQNFNGYPETSPRTSEYFNHPSRKNDTYSIAFSFTPNTDINGNDLLFGNDFDHPIRDLLPMGFSVGVGIAQRFIDPTLQIDAYADKPYMFSPALANLNHFRVGAKDSREQLLKGDTVVEEGVDDGEDLHLPSTGAARRKYFQAEDKRKAFTFSAGRQYVADFGNSFLDFNELSLNLPGFSLPVRNLVNSDNRELRYVLKDSKTDAVYLVVVFTVILEDEEQGSKA